MKYLNTLFFLILFSCTSCKDATLLDFQPAYHNVDTSKSNALKEIRFYKMVSPNNIIGLGYNIVFETRDKFKTGDIFSKNDGFYASYIAYASNNSDSLVLTSGNIFSLYADRGKKPLKTISLPPYNIDYTPPGQPYRETGIHNYKDSHFFNSKEGVVLVDYLGNSHSEILIYKITDFNRYDTLSKIAFSFPNSGRAVGLKLKMVNDNIGYMFVADNKTSDYYLMKTVDRCKTWTLIPTKISNGSKGLIDLIVLSENQIVVWGENGLTSSDGGKTWSPWLVNSEISRNYTGLYKINSQILYASYELPIRDAWGFHNKLIKSTDSGKTWKEIGGPFYGGNIQFYDENNALAGNGALVQISNNGGLSWELVSAPTFK
jgi:hypothetical protein